MDAIIFLAPISAFDQVLDEAPKVNRLVSSHSLKGRRTERCVGGYCAFMDFDCFLSSSLPY